MIGSEGMIFWLILRKKFLVDLRISNSFWEVYPFIMLTEVSIIISHLLGQKIV